MSLLRVEGVTKNFGGLRALHDVSFIVGKNEVLGIIGPNGAGKSTLFNVISGFEEPSGGKIFLGEKDITGLKASTIARHEVIRTWQENRLVMNETVTQHIVLSFALYRGTQFWGALLKTASYRSLEKEIKEKAEALLKEVGLGGLGNKLAGELTHGQQRLLGIAMGLACRPRLMMVDEPFTGMNVQEIKFASEVLMRIMKENQFSLIMIEHNMRLIMGLCERIIVLDHGNKIAEGTPLEISTNKDVIQAYLGASKNVGS